MLRAGTGYPHFADARGVDVIIKGADIVAEARRWVETPFHHQGRVLGAGVDCVGLVVGVARALGLSEHDVRGYGRIPNAGMIEAELEAHLDRVAIRDLRAGDILLLRIKDDPQHVAIVSSLEPLSAIHAHIGVGKCVEHRLDALWQCRVLKAYRYRGVEE